MPDGSYVLRHPWTTSRGETCYSVHETTDGYIGRISGAGDRWEWTTDLGKLRMAQQLQGTAGSLEAAQAAFKQAYEAFREPLTDKQFNGLYRRNWKP